MVSSGIMNLVAACGGHQEPYEMLQPQIIWILHCYVISLLSHAEEICYVLWILLLFCDLDTTNEVAVVMHDVVEAHKLKEQSHIKHHEI